MGNKRQLTQNELHQSGDKHCGYSHSIKQRRTLRRSALALAVAAVLGLSLGAQAQSQHVVYYQGRPFMVINVLDAGEMAPINTDIYGEEEAALMLPDARAEKDLDPKLLQTAVTTLPYFAELLERDLSFAVDSDGLPLAQFYLYSRDTGNNYSLTAATIAGFNQDMVTGVRSPHTALYDSLVLGQVSNDYNWFYFTSYDYELEDHLFTLPQSEVMSAQSIFVHEFYHLLGLCFYDTGTTMAYNDHLYDYFGTHFEPGMECYNIYNLTDDELSSLIGRAFIAGEYSFSGVTFRGEHVAEVQAGQNFAWPGIPISGFENGVADLTHLELEHSVFSHQLYISYTHPMELELAFLQDLGYTIDRKNFYGRTVLGDGQTIHNHQGYYARNAAGTAYIEGVPNTATLGIGLHVYGKYNTIYQEADLLAGGVAGVGVRVDGTDNSLYLTSGTTIAADGQYGTGILFAYGKESELRVDGRVQALGQDGIALRFDFGHSMNDDDYQFRGSYIWTGEYSHYELVDKNGNVYHARLEDNDDGYGFELNLDGPLMDKVAINGTLLATDSAIYIADMALVQNIDVNGGALIVGDLTSNWDPQNPDLDKQYIKTYHPDLYTHLNIDHGTDTAAVNWRGNINGAASIKMTITPEATLNLLGNIDVYSLINYGNLILLPGAGTQFSQNSPTARATFTNSTGGSVIKAQELLKLDPGSNLTLADNTTISAKEVQLGGSLTILPEQRFYANGEQVSWQLKLESNKVSGDFNEINAVRSPTLDVVAQGRLSGNSYNIITTFNRSEQAYSKYAHNQSSAAVGTALDYLAAAGERDLAPLLSALDLSAPDGSEIGAALNTLSPTSFDAIAAAQLMQEQLYSHLLTKQLDATAVHALTSDKSQAFVTINSSYTDGDGDNVQGISGYERDDTSLMAGIIKPLGKGLAVGAQLLAAHYETDATDVSHATAEGNSLYLGASLS